MAELSAELLAKILRDCLDGSSEPTYPGPYAQANGIDRRTLDAHLDQLRLKGLISLTDWVQGKGQGYVITPAGREVLTPRSNKLSSLPNTAGDNRAAAEPRASTWQRGEAVRQAMLQAPRPIVTNTLIAINVLVFVIGGLIGMTRQVPLEDYLTGSGTEALGILYYDMGEVVQRRVLLDNQWWRLLAYSVVHGGVLHIFMNMYFLYSLGPRLECMWGAWRYLFLYLLSAVAGGIAVVLVNSKAIGASGALCGLLTSMIFWVWLNRPYLGSDFSRMFLRNIFLNVALIAAISLLPFVSRAGHLGGGLAGLLVAYPMTYHRFGTPTQRLLGLAGMAGVVLASLAICVGMWELMH